jgi:hypothetical protein
MPRAGSGTGTLPRDEVGGYGGAGKKTPSSVGGLYPSIGDSDARTDRWVRRTRISCSFSRIGTCPDWWSTLRRDWGLGLLPSAPPDQASRYDLEVPESWRDFRHHMVAVGPGVRRGPRNSRSGQMFTRLHRRQLLELPGDTDAVSAETPRRTGLVLHVHSLFQYSCALWAPNGDTEAGVVTT